MNCEQKYNKILEKATKELQACGSTDCDAYRLIIRLFPELKESEDERIKRQLVNFLEELSKLGRNMNFERYSTADCADWVCWLEKQKPVSVEKSHKIAFPEIAIKQGFIAGARWADNHPVIKVGDAAKNYQRGYEEAINKARTWLYDNQDGWLDIDEFCKAMEE